MFTLPATACQSAGQQSNSSLVSMHPHKRCGRFENQNERRAMFDGIVMLAAAAGAGTVLSALAMRLFESRAGEDVAKLERETEQLREIAAEDERTTQSHKSLARQLSNLLVELRIIKKDFIYFRWVNFFQKILFFILGALFLMAARWIGFDP
jgi:hypothetical protein